VGAKSVPTVDVDAQARPADKASTASPLLGTHRALRLRMEIIISLLAVAILFGCITGLMSLRRDAQRFWLDQPSSAEATFQATPGDEPSRPLDRA
jgi:hypothetical protein